MATSLPTQEGDMVNSTLDAPLATPGTSFSADPTQRPRACMQPVRFAPAIWVNKALEQGLFPTPRSFTVASAIARAVDADGRWCFKYLTTLADSSGRLLSKRTIQRGVEDLVRAKIVRKLDERQVRVFFWRKLAAGWRTAEHMPCVLELCIPARDFPGPALEQINHVRRELGEEPLDETTRPRLYPAPTKKRCAPAKETPEPGPGQGAGTSAPMGTESNNPTPESEESGQLDQGVWSKCPPDLSPTDSSSTGAGTSVRGTSTTGRRAHTLIARIPNALLNNPANDRDLLGRAVEALAEYGMDEQQLTALLSGAEQLRKPFPGLMNRLSSPQRALAFLSGQLGLGLNRPQGPATGPARPVHEDTDFVLDSQGRAARTCPDHPGVRNTPGDPCSVCARPCRTSPDQPPPEPAPPAKGRTDEAGPQTPAPDPEPDCEADPELARRMRQSLKQAGKAEPAGPMALQTPPRHPPARQATIDALRQDLGRIQDATRPDANRTPTSTTPSPPPPSRPRYRTPEPGTDPARTGRTLPAPAPTGAHPRPQQALTSTPTAQTAAPTLPGPRPEPPGSTRTATPVATRAAAVTAARPLVAALALPPPASAPELNSVPPAPRAPSAGTRAGGTAEAPRAPGRAGGTREWAEHLRPPGPER